MSDLTQQRQINDLYRTLQDVQNRLGTVERLPPVVSEPDTNTNPGQAANQCRNGSFAHSVQSWFPQQDIPSDGDYECAWWYSHSDAANTALDLTSSSASSSAARPSGFTPTNVSDDYDFDANATTVDELADVLGTLLNVLTARGII